MHSETLQDYMWLLKHLLLHNLAVEQNLDIQFRILDRVWKLKWAYKILLSFRLCPNLPGRSGGILLEKIAKVKHIRCIFCSFKCKVISTKDFQIYWKITLQPESSWPPQDAQTPTWLKAYFDYSLWAKPNITSLHKQ